MNFLKENTGTLVAFLALFNLSISITYNYFYFGAFDLSLDMIPATYSDYLISSLDVLTVLLIHSVVAGVLFPFFSYYESRSSDINLMELSNRDRRDPSYLLRALIKDKISASIFAALFCSFVILSVILHFDLYFNRFVISIYRNFSGIFFVFCLIYPIFLHVYGKAISRITTAVFFAFSIAAFWGSIAGHSIRFSEYIPHAVKVSGCNNCVVIKSLSDTYILWNQGANKVVMINKSEVDILSIELRTNGKVK